MARKQKQQKQNRKKEEEEEEEKPKTAVDEEGEQEIAAEELEEEEEEFDEDEDEREDRDAENMLVKTSSSYSNSFSRGFPLPFIKTHCFQDLTLVATSLGTQLHLTEYSMTRWWSVQREQKEIEKTIKNQKILIIRIYIFSDSFFFFFFEPNEQNIPPFAA